MAGQLPGFEMAPAVAVCIGAAVVAVLRLPLASLILASVLAVKAGPGAMPLVIVGVAAAYLATLYMDGFGWVGSGSDDGPEPAAAGAGGTAGVAPGSDPWPQLRRARPGSVTRTPGAVNLAAEVRRRLLRP